MIPLGLAQEPRHHFQAGVVGDDGWMLMLLREMEKSPLWSWSYGLRTFQFSLYQDKHCFCTS